VLATHTASAVIATQSAVFPRLSVANGVSSAIDLGAAPMRAHKKHSANAAAKKLNLERFIAEVCAWFAGV
jgi:hypothetical protein